ncbi:MAG: adenosylcobinamide-GDP ribazoletransferase, partial [Verrucomicrobiota bacterium]
MLFFRSIRAAFIFLTRIPLGGFPYSSEEWRWSTAHFPLVGAGLGALLAGLWWLFAPVIGPWPTAFL